MQLGPQDEGISRCIAPLNIAVNLPACAAVGTHLMETHRPAQDGLPVLRLQTRDLAQISQGPAEATHSPIHVAPPEQQADQDCAAPFFLVGRAMPADLEADLADLLAVARVGLKLR